jgi:hypothetical protein
VLHVIWHSIPMTIAAVLSFLSRSKLFLMGDFLIHDPPKYLTSNLSLCCTRFILLLKALQSFFSCHPNSSSSSNCVYANTLASNNAGLSLPKNQESSPSNIDSASNALSASLYKSSVSMIEVCFSSSASAAARSWCDMEP